MATYNDSVNRIIKDMTELKGEVSHISEQVAEDIGNLLKTINDDIGAFNSLCQIVIEDLYHAKLSILYDEYEALQVAKTVYSVRQYQDKLHATPWYGKLFKSQLNKIKEEAEQSAEKRFKLRFDKLKKEIEDFSFEEYSKRFNNEEEMASESSDFLETSNN